MSGQWGEGRIALGRKGLCERKLIGGMRQNGASLHARATLFTNDAEACFAAFGRICLPGHHAWRTLLVGLGRGRTEEFVNLVCAG